jgi:hypothetical protein
MQQQLNESYPELEVQIIGVNERGHELGNPIITKDRSLPWLQDLDADQDGASDNFMNRWDYAYRDVVIVDAQNVPIEAYNLTENDLGQPENFDALMTKLINAAQQVQVPSWTNPLDPLDVNNDTDISPLDALLVINELNGRGARELEPPGGPNGPPPFLDTTGDGFVSPRDALLVINRLNVINSVQSAPAAAAALAAETLKPVPAVSPAEGEPSSPSHNNRTYLLAAAIDEIFVFDHDDDGSPKRRVLSEDAHVGPRR